MSLTAGKAILLSSAAGGGYEVSRSLRFNSSDSAYLSRTPASSGNRRTFTWSSWVKRSKLGGDQQLLLAAPSVSDTSHIRFDSDDTLHVFEYTGSFTWRLQTSQVFRDTSAWYHILVAIDTTQAASSDRVKIYVNGTQVTAFSTASYPSQNKDTQFNNAVDHSIGRNPYYGNYFDGYLADVVWVDGQQLTPSSLVETSATTGQLIPKAYTGSYGTNGFWLKFSDNSAATATTLGKDYSGNGNNWTPNNFLASQNLYPLYLQPTTGWWTNSSYTAVNAFDGSLSTFAITDTRAIGEGVNFAPSQPITITSSLRYYCGATWMGGGSNAAYIQIGSDTSTRFNVTVSNDGSWVTLPNAAGKSLSTSTPLIVRITGGNPQVWVTAIEVDGTVLTGGTGVGIDSLVDTPTSYGTDTGAGGEVRGNYATLNPLKTPGGSTTFSNGNLETTFAFNGVNFPVPMGTFGVSSGKWYWEITPTSGASGSGGVGIGIGNAQCAPTNAGAFGVTANGWGYYYSGNKYNNNTSSSYGASYTNNDVIGVALDCDNGTLVFYKNGASQGTAYTGLTSGPYFPAMGNAGDTTTCVFNAGQRPFAYTAPSGFKALCDTNLPAPVVAKPSTVMDVKLYSGTSATQSITGLAFSPDFVWIKERNAGSWHQLNDAVRGANKQLYSNDTASEGTQTDRLQSFDSAGFTLGNSVSGGVNNSGSNYVAWAWDAGSSTVTNTQGSITSQVRANASAGFSIVTYTGTGSAGTVGHGLGVAPAMFIVKNRSASSDWDVYHSALPSPATNRIVLQSTAAAVGAGGTSAWNSTNPTSTVISLGAGTSLNNNGSSHVLYAFSPVTGYSSFGSYTGNGSLTDGTFVYTGFRPRFILAKGSSFVTEWLMIDTARDTYNVSNKRLDANAANAESQPFNYFDVLSNGFKLRSGAMNNNGETVIYAAFAENPFQYARAR